MLALHSVISQQTVLGRAFLKPPALTGFQVRLQQCSGLKTSGNKLECLQGNYLVGVLIYLIIAFADFMLLLCIKNQEDILHKLDSILL